MGCRGGHGAKGNGARVRTFGLCVEMGRWGGGSEARARVCIGRRGVGGGLWGAKWHEISHANIKYLSSSLAVFK